MRMHAEKEGTPERASTRPPDVVRLVSSPGHALRDLNRTIGNLAAQRLLRGSAGLPAPLRAKLAVNAPGDSFEREADRVAEQVMRVAAPGVRRTCACGGECPECRARERERLQARRSGTERAAEATAPPIVDEVLREPGQPLDTRARAALEPRFGYDFGGVRVHADARAGESARAIHAHAYTVGRHVVFAEGRYAPGAEAGLRLLAHELTHVVQQGAAPPTRERAGAPAPAGEPHVQRTIGDGHDLTSQRFRLLEDLEAAYDGEVVIRRGSRGRGVQAIQQALYDLGFPLPTSGADGDFGDETVAAVKAFQLANPPLVDDGEVGALTMAALEARFPGAPALPPSATRSAPWTAACVRGVLCPWSPHTVDVLRTRITLKSFDSISWADEEWNGAAWVPAPFPGGGYNTGVEIGVLNSSCERMAETLYHEVLHAEQPTRHATTLQKESYAYRIGEEFSIALGLGGRPALRATDPRGRQFADPARVGAFVAGVYPSVPSGGGGDQIIGKAAAPGHVIVQRPDGSTYTRPAVVGEKVPGPITLVNEVTHSTAGWTCP